MDYEEETYFRGGRYNHDDDFHDDIDDVYSERHHGKGKDCHHCGCNHQHRRRGCTCDCHSHNHHHDRRRCHCHCKSHYDRDRWCDCDCHRDREVHHVCRELAMILREQRRPQKKDCGCTASIQQLKGSNQRVILPFILVTRGGQLFVEWGRQRHHHSYATVFFSVVKVNCRHNEAVLELLKPNKPITNPHTGKVDKRRIRDVDYVVPTGERVCVDLAPMREVRRLPKNFVKGYW